VTSSYIDRTFRQNSAVLQYLPKSQIHRLKQIQNSLARADVKAPKFTHTTPILKSLHWLKINERIQYKILYLQWWTKVD